MKRRRQHQHPISTETDWTTNKNDHDDDDVAFVDQDDQDDIVALLEQEGLEQMARTNFIFTSICVLATTVTAVLTIVTYGGEMGPCIHVVYSAGVHWLSRTHATSATVTSLRSLQQSSSLQQRRRRQQQQSPTSGRRSTVALLIFLIISPLFVIASSVSTLNANDTATLHWSIAFANILVAICSIVLRIESVNTLEALKELEGSKYRYKSL